MYKVVESIQKRGGPALPGVMVNVYTYPGNDPVTVYEDDEITPMPYVVTDINGMYDFNIEPGQYTLTFTYNGTVFLTIPKITYGSGDLAVELSDSSGSAMVGFLQSGTGAVARTLQSKLRETVSVKDFGAVGDGTTDDTDAIQAAIDAVEANGGGEILIPGGDYLISSTLTIDNNGVYLRGEGCGWNQSSIALIRSSSRTRLLWGGGAETMVLFTSVAGEEPKVGGGISDVMLDGQSTATKCLEIRSFRGLEITRVYAFAFATNGFFTGAFSGSLSAQPYDTQFCKFDTCRCDNRNLGALTGNGVQLTGGQGNGGATGGNTSFNTFINCEFGTNSPGYGLYLEDTDNNYFFNCKISGDGTLLGSEDQNSQGSTGHARYNQFIGCESTVVCKASQTGGDSSASNLFFGFPRSNGKALPTLETGAGGSSDATAIVFSTDEIAGSSPLKSTVRHRMEARLSVGNNSTQAGHAESSGASVCIGNGSSNQLVLTNGTESWGININATNGNLRLIRSAGSGIIRLENNTTIVGQAGFNGTAPIAKPTVSGSRGGNAALASLLTALANYGLITDSSSA